MALSLPTQTGLALAALLASDGDLARVRAALSEEDAAAVALLLAARPDEPRSARIARLLAALRPPLAPSSRLPPRLRALLAPKLPRARARPLLEAAPPPRAGFAADGELLARLTRIARATSGTGGPA